MHIRSIRPPRFALPTPRIRTACAIIATVLGAGTASAQTPLKVYISADMEGITGVVSPEQLGPTGFEYQRAREWMTGEVLAAIQGARDAGATEIVVSDSHGNGQNLLIDQLPDDITIIRSWPRPLMMMEGIDSTFDAAVFIGYHSATTNVKGVRAHTISSARLAGVHLNGTAMPESGINAAIAGHFGVPIVAISGDDAAVAEAQALVGPMEGAVVKRAISYHAAATLTPAAGQRLIRERVRAGIQRRASIRPYLLSGPVTLEVTFKSYRPAEMLAWLPMVQRKDAHSIRYLAPDMIAVSKFIEFITTYGVEIEP